MPPPHQKKKKSWHWAVAPRACQGMTDFCVHKASIVHPLVCLVVFVLWWSAIAAFVVWWSAALLCQVRWSVWGANEPWSDPLISPFNSKRFRAFLVTPVPDARWWSFPFIYNSQVFSAIKVLMFQIWIQLCGLFCPKNAWLVETLGSISALNHGNSRQYRLVSTF